MSDLTLFKSDKLPAYLKKIARDDITKSMVGSGGVPRISIKGSVFRKIVGGEEVMKNEDRAMNMVIINSAPTEYRTYYGGTFKEGENKGPDCWSSDGVAPDATVEEPQSPKCATCPQNIKGSGQGDSRACRFSRWLAVALENDLEGDVLQLVLPSQSVFGKGEKGKLPLRQYAKFLDAHNLPITAVVTEMRFDTDSATPKLTFKPVRPLEEAEYLQCRERAESVEAVEAITMRYAPNKKAAGVEVDDESAAVVKAAAAKHASKPKADDDDEEEAPRVRGKTKESDVKSVLDQWADDDE
jgi:hypothetical protein